MTVLSVIACCQAGQLATPLAQLAYNAPLTYSAPLGASPLTYAAAAGPFAYNAAAAPFAPYNAAYATPFGYNAAYAAAPLAYNGGLAYTSQYINQPAYAPLAKSVAYSSPLLAGAPLSAAAYSLPAPYVSFGSRLTSRPSCLIDLIRLI